MTRIRFLFILSVISAGMFACQITQHTERLYTVTGSIYVTSDYCGGANPPEELLENLQIPKPYPGKKIFIRSGTKNDFDQPILYALTTDSAGLFSFQLPAGSYCIVDEYRVRRGFTDSLFVDKVPQVKITDHWCIKQWLEEGLLLFKVEKKGVVLDRITIHQRCFVHEGIPCLEYTGPLPQ